MDATLIRLLGAFLPKTLDGTIAGRFAASAAPIEAFTVLPKNLRRLMPGLFPFGMV
jgi:hypothetical protein